MRPNIVFIQADDLDTPLFDRARALGRMPNFDRFIGNVGTKFDQYFVNDARGTPVRTSQLSGKYFHNMMDKYHSIAVYNFDDTQTLPVWMKSAGYRTAWVGKYMDGYGYNDANHDGVVDKADATYIPPGIDYWCSVPYYAAQLNGTVPPMNAPVPLIQYETINNDNYFLTCNGDLRHMGPAENEYLTDVMKAKAAGFIASAPQLRPWVMFLQTSAPHIEGGAAMTGVYGDLFRWTVTPPIRYVNTISEGAPQVPNFNEANVTDKPFWVSSKPPMDVGDIIANDDQWDRRLESLFAVDDLIGSVAASLQARGKLASTIFIFTSDNGWQNGNHRLGGKLDAYTESTNVPLYVSIGGGVTSHALITPPDITATMLELSVVAPDAGVVLDGTSFVPLLTDPGKPWRKRMEIYHWTGLSGDFGLFDMEQYHAIRSSIDEPVAPNMLLVSYPNDLDELYDNEADPYQLDNQISATDPVSRRKKQALGMYMQPLSVCVGSACHDLEFQ